MSVLRAFPFLALSLAAVAGCNGNESTGVVPEQLEAVEVAGEMEYEEVQIEGALSVTGTERDFTLSLETSAGSRELSIHSPGMSDLSLLNGRSVTAKLANKGLHEERSVVISDDKGTAYVADVGHGVDADALFGEGFVRWGETVGTSSDDLYDWEYTPAVFKTDEGEIEVLPGDTANLKIKGATWRVAVIAAYKVTPHPDAPLPCGGISDLLSYEMIRVETAKEPVKLTRMANAKLAHLGCM